jgi:hypothetical protein
MPDSIAVEKQKKEWLSRRGTQPSPHSRNGAARLHRFAPQYPESKSTSLSSIF